MADNSGVIKMALFAGAGYLAYKQGWLSMLGIGAPAPVVPVSSTPAVVTPVVDPNAVVGANTVAAIQARTIAAAKAPAVGLTIDGWSWYVNNELQPLGKAAPDPMPLFSAAIPGFDRSQNVTASQYWAVMGPALKAQTGLSGLGLYGFGGRF